MHQVKRPDYVKYDEEGRLSELYCKLCGSQIGGRVRVLIGKRMEDGVLSNDYIVEFKRFPNYAEGKIEFHDGSAHVTLGCKDCLTGKLDPETLDAIHQADLDQAPSEYVERYKDRISKRLIGVKRGGGIR